MIETLNQDPTPKSQGAEGGRPAVPLFGIWVDANDQKPQTGIKVLVCGHWSNGNRWRTTATWQPAGTVDASMWDDPPEDWWDEDGNVCTNPTDEWSETAVEGERSYALENVTHWMPLPDMPNAIGEARADNATPNQNQTL